MAVPSVLCLTFTGTPDSYWSWIVCVCAALSQALTIGVLVSFGVLFPVFMDYFQETREKTAWVGSVGIALVFFFGPLTGSLINRFGCRITTIAGGLICVASLIVSSFVNSIAALFITYSVLFGLGSSFVFGSSWVVVSKYFQKRRSLALGLVGGGQGLGVMAQGPLLQFLLDTTDWRGTFRVMAAVVFINCLVALSYAPVLEDANCEPDGSIDGSIQCKNVKSKKVPGNFSLDFSVCKVPIVVAVALSAGLLHLGRFTPQIHLVKYTATLGISADSASTLYIFIGMASIIGRICTGFICDLHCVNSLYVYQAAVFFQGVSTLLSTLAKTYVPLAVFAFVFGLCDGAFITTLNICLLKSVDSSRRASVIALHHPVISVFLASGAPLSGLIADKTGSYVPAFLMAGGFIVVASAVPFVLLSPCLTRYAVRVRDQNENTEVLQSDVRPSISNADNVGFVADESMDRDKDDVERNEAPIIIVQDTSDADTNVETHANKHETKVDVHNKITRERKETCTTCAGNDHYDRELEEEHSGNTLDLNISADEEGNTNDQNTPEAENLDSLQKQETYVIDEGANLTYAANEGFISDDADDEQTDPAEQKNADPHENGGFTINEEPATSRVPSEEPATSRVPSEELEAEQDVSTLPSDAKMGDDKTENEGLAQEHENKTKEAEDRTKEAEDRTKEAEDRTKETEDRTKETEDRTKEAEDRTKEAEDRTKETEDRTKEAEDRTKEAEDRTKEAEDRTKETEDRTKEAEDRTKEAEDRTAVRHADNAGSLVDSVHDIQDINMIGDDAQENGSMEAELYCTDDMVAIDTTYSKRDAAVEDEEENTEENTITEEARPQSDYLINDIINEPNQGPANTAGSETTDQLPNQ